MYNLILYYNIPTGWLLNNPSSTVRSVFHGKSNIIGIYYVYAMYRCISVWVYLSFAYLGSQTNQHQSPIRFSTWYIFEVIASFSGLWGVRFARGKTFVSRHETQRKLAGDRRDSIFTHIHIANPNYGVSNTNCTAWNSNF